MFKFLPIVLALAVPAGAETITMTIATNGQVIPVAGTLVQSQSSTSFQVNAAALNAVLAADGSAYRFSSLGVSTGWPGQPGPEGGSVITTAGVFVPAGAAGALGLLTIAASEDGFTAPTGPAGLLLTSVSGNAVNTPAGATGGGASSFNGAFGPTLTTASTGPAPNSQSLSGLGTIGAVAAPYTLGNRLTILVPSIGVAAQAQGGYSVSTQALAVPEPAGLLLLGLGVAVPLSRSLLRRRSA